jgi:hypothetical protein
MLGIEKIGGKKVIFKIFFAESQKIALGKKFLCREPASCLSVKESLASVFFCAESFFSTRQRSVFSLPRAK